MSYAQEREREREMAWREEKGARRRQPRREEHQHNRRMHQARARGGKVKPNSRWWCLACVRACGALSVVWCASEENGMERRATQTRLFSSLPLLPLRVRAPVYLSPHNSALLIPFLDLISLHSGQLGSNTFIPSPQDSSSSFSSLIDT